jgi:hypothetical protein
MSMGAQSGYAIPVSPMEKAVGQECANPIAAVKESRQKYQRCMQRVGGKEVVKAAQCQTEEKRLQGDEAELEKCKLITSHNLMKNLTDEQAGMKSAG